MNNKLSKIKCIAIFLAGISATSIPAIARADWSIVSLGNFNGTGSTAMAINNSGYITGYVHINGAVSYTFITGPNGVGSTTYVGNIMGSGNGYAINDTGQIIFGTLGHSFITGPNGVGITDIGTLGGSQSSARGINNSGQVVGRSWTENGAHHAFITGPNGVGMTDLGTLGGINSEGISINESGQVVGYSNITGNTADHAFITGANGVGMTDLGTLGGSSSYANDINDLGQTVGSSETSDGYRHAFITGANGTGMIDLGAMGGYSSDALGINNVGQAVGYAMPCFNCLPRAFVYSDGVMVNISALDEVASAGWTNMIARGINDSGQIVGEGFMNGVYQGFLISGADDRDFFHSYVEVPLPVPEPETYAMLLAGLGLLGFMARRRKETAQFNLTQGEKI